jgi:hypothetical protein
MIALRQIHEVKSGAVTVNLPAHFRAKLVEIIILPFEESKNGGSSLQELLLEAPTLTEDELQEFNRVRQWMSQWSVQVF